MRDLHYSQEACFSHSFNGPRNLYFAMGSERRDSPASRGNSKDLLSCCSPKAKSCLYKVLTAVTPSHSCDWWWDGRLTESGLKEAFSLFAPPPPCLPLALDQPILITEFLRPSKLSLGSSLQNFAISANCAASAGGGGCLMKIATICPDSSGETG